jgi:hydroxymethylglutaryl-CoA lyase
MPRPSKAKEHSAARKRKGEHVTDNSKSRAEGLWALVPSKVTLRDVTLRDGLQSESLVLDLRDKLSLVEAMIDAGIREMEVTAFVHPGKVPAMADAEGLWQALPRRPDVSFSALVFNPRGLDRALEAGVDHIAVVVSASDAHSRRNTGKSIEASLDEARDVLARASKAGVTTRAGVMSAFGCRLEGRIPAERVGDLVRALHETGPQEMTLADTSGTGDPPQILERVGSCRKIVGDTRLSLHLHDATGWALANLTTALQLGVDTFDVTLGGLGGCPFLPGAPGNLAVHPVGRFLEAMGITTGVDLDKLQGGLQSLERMVSTARGQGSGIR